VAQTTAVVRLPYAAKMTVSHASDTIILNNYRHNYLNNFAFRFFLVNLLSIGMI